MGQPRRLAVLLAVAAVEWELEAMEAPVVRNPIPFHLVFQLAAAAAVSEGLEEMEEQL